MVMFSQTRGKIEERGHSRFSRDGTINGFRPGPGKEDLAWATAMGERAKVLMYLFRPGRWARACGLNEKDDKLELIFAKVNFGVEGTIVTQWDGAKSVISDKR